LVIPAHLRDGIGAIRRKSKVSKYDGILMWRLDSQNVKNPQPDEVAVIGWVMRRIGPANGVYGLKQDFQFYGGLTLWAEF